MDTAHYHELGTLSSGYSEQGPFSCSNCIHKPEKDAPFCNHPVVVADPDRQAFRQGDLVQINLKKGCCRFVKPPEVIALVLRHGDTILNDEGKLRSRLDVPLDDGGQKQATEAADFLLKNYPNITQIYVAPLQRTQQTVAPIAEALKLEPQVLDELNTWNMGVLIGQKKDDVKDVMDYFVENSAEPIPQGESLQAHVDEMMSAVEPILEKAEDEGPILICMTSSSIIPLLKLIEGVPIEEPTDAYGVGPGGILAISLEGEGYKIEPVFGEVAPAEVGAS